MSLDDFMWWYWVEEYSCPKCGSGDIEQIDLDTFKCHSCGHVWHARL